MKAFIKIILTLIMLIGIAFSISNLFLIELKASSLEGIRYMGECMDDFDECSIGYVED